MLYELTHLLSSDSRPLTELQFQQKQADFWQDKIQDKVFHNLYYWRWFTASKQTKYENSLYVSSLKS